LIEIPVCLAASTTNIALDGSVTVLDGIDITAGGIVLVRANTDKTENGIYIPLSTGWLRWEDHRAGSLVIVLRGDVYEDTLWKNINPDLDFGTTEIEYKKLPFKVSDLLDVLLTTLTTDDILKWNGTKWVNVPFPTGVENLVDLDDVNIAALANGKALVWDSATSEFVFVTIPGMPSGTTTHSTLRYNGTAFIESVKHLAKIFSTQNGYEIISPNGSRNISLDAKNDSVYNQFKYDSDRFIDMEITSAISRMLLRSQTCFLDLKTFNSYDAANKVESLAWSGTERFYIKQLGEIFSNIFTANTLLKANSNKEIVSIANAAGYLYNNGSGVFSFATPSGGTDINVKISSADTTTGYLNDKIALVNLTGAIINPGANEQLQITGPADISELTDTTGLIPAAQVNSDWDAVSGVAQILNKPTIPAAQIQSDYTQTDTGAVDFIKNKPHIQEHFGKCSLNGIGAFQTIANLQMSTTTLADITGTALTLKADTMYKFNCDLIMQWIKDATLYADDTEFIIQFTTTGDTAVLGTLFGNHLWYVHDNSGLAEYCTQLTLNSPKLFLLTGNTDSQVRLMDSHFGGFISGGAGGGTIVMQMRISTTGFIDNYMILKILGGTNATIMEVNNS